MPSQTNAPLRRARVACKACHARRSKCDATETEPCWHCRTRQLRCELIQSKRGKYPRVKKSAGSAGSLTSTTSLPDHQYPVDTFRQDAPVNTEATLQQLTPPEVPVRRGSEVILDVQQSEPGQSQDGLQCPEGPEMLYARLAEPDSAEMLDGRDRCRDYGRYYYLGESFSLSYLVRTVCRPSAGATEPVRAHYPVPPSVADRSRMLYSPRPLSDALQMLEKTASDELVRLFFTRFYPAYPVLDRRDFITTYQQGRMSFLQLNTIYFLSLSICSQDLLVKLGYKDRASAKATHYHLARALYEAEYETDSVKLTGVLFLLGFWWAGPEEQKDSWHWIGSAISLAQTLGMHRSSAHSGMSNRQQALRRRIWWSLYVRDKISGAALGRPCRIHDRDCDVEMVMESDLWVDDVYDAELLCHQQPFHVYYFIEMSKLGTILGDIVVGEFSPVKNKVFGYDWKSSADALKKWEAKLPPEMRRTTLGRSLEGPFWAAILHVMYHNCQILLFRPKTIEVSTSEDRERDSLALLAANSITRIAEDLLTVGLMTSAPLHLIPGLFCALSIHTIVTYRKNPVLRQLAENRSRQCMLALSELSKSWPTGGWILRVFISLNNRLTGENATVSSFNASMASTASQQVGNVAKSLIAPHTQNDDLPRDIDDRPRGPTSIGTNQCNPSLDQQPGYEHLMLMPTADAIFADAFWDDAWPYTGFEPEPFQNPAESFFNTSQ